VHRTPPGSPDSKVFIFDLPKGVASPALTGDIPDDGQFRRVKIAL